MENESAANARKKEERRRRERKEEREREAKLEKWTVKSPKSHLTIRQRVRCGRQAGEGRGGRGLLGSGRHVTIPIKGELNLCLI